MGMSELLFDFTISVCFRANTVLTEMQCKKLLVSGENASPVLSNSIQKTHYHCP